MLRRRSRLVAKTPLARRTPLRTTKEKRTGHRDTGPDRSTRELVLERDDYRCVNINCGKSIYAGQYSIQHRVARGVGGGNSPVNLIVLCGSATSPDGCHSWAEARKAEARDLGYWLKSHQDPARVPVHHYTHGLVFLLADGSVEPVPHVDGSAA